MIGVVKVVCPECGASVNMLTGVGSDTAICRCGATLTMKLGQDQPTVVKTGREE